MRDPLRKMLWKYYRGKLEIFEALKLLNKILLSQFSEFSTKDYQKLYGHDRGGEFVFGKWILPGVNWIFVQGNYN